MKRWGLLHPSRWPASLRDLSALVVLAIVAVVLGLYARAGRPVVTVAPDAIAHPSFGLAAFRTHVEAGTALVLDARSAAEYAAGHVPGALSLPSHDFDAAYALLAEHLAPRRDQLLIVYCSDLWCSLGDELQQRLVSRGFARVGRFPEGWTVWLNARLPVEGATVPLKL